MIINSSFIQNIGINGKCGAALFFYSLYEETKNKNYLDIAERLVEQIQVNLNINKPINFTFGLSGIAWFFRYLLDNGYIESDQDEFFTDFDKHLLQTIKKGPSYKHSHNDFYWPGLYLFLVRKNNANLITDFSYTIITDIKKILSEKDLNYSMNFIISLIFALNKCKKFLTSNIAMQCEESLCKIIKTSNLYRHDFITLSHINCPQSFPLIHNEIFNKQIKDIGSVLQFMPQIIQQKLLWNNENINLYIQSLIPNLYREIETIPPMDKTRELGITGWAAYGVALIKE